MKGWNMVLVGKPGIRVRLATWIAARFQQQNFHSRFGEPRGQRAASGPGADHDVVVIAGRQVLHDQNVLMNAISARLSSSLNGGSVPKPFSSALNPSVSLNFAVPK